MILAAKPPRLTMTTSSATSLEAATTRAIRDAPPTSTSAFGRPRRREGPPAKTIAPRTSLASTEARIWGTLKTVASHENFVRFLLSVSILALLIPVAAADHVDLEDLYPIAPWDALDSIVQPRFDDEPYVYLWDEVVGVTIGNESRTYPLKLMHWHEVVNDVVGGVPIVVSLCPLCGTALVFERTYEGRVLTFGSSGFLLANNKVMYDRETGSLWPQILGIAINGTYHGTRLKPVEALRLPYQEWAALHPEASTVARPWGPILCPDPCLIPFGFTSYDGSPYDNSTSLYGETNATYEPIRYPDLRLHPKTYVVGLARGGDALAVPLPALDSLRVIPVTVGGESLVVALWKPPEGGRVPGAVNVFLAEGRTFTVDPATNELVDAGGDRYAILTGEGASGNLTQAEFVHGFWFAWHDLHPGTRVYGYETVPSSPPYYLALAAIPVGLAGAYLWRRRAKRFAP